MGPERQPVIKLASIRNHKLSEHELQAWETAIYFNYEY